MIHPGRKRHIPVRSEILPVMLVLLERRIIVDVRRVDIRLPFFIGAGRRVGPIARYPVVGGHAFIGDFRIEVFNGRHGEISVSKLKWNSERGLARSDGQSVNPVRSLAAFASAATRSASAARAASTAGSAFNCATNGAFRGSWSDTVNSFGASGTGALIGVSPRGGSLEMSSTQPSPSLLACSALSTIVNT